MLSANKNSFLTLVRMGIGHSCVLPDVVDWQAIKTLSDKQGLTAIIVDGIEKLPDTKRPPKELLLQWIGEVFQNYENRYKLYQRAIAELAGWYNAHGYKMMVLKGYACSIDWAKPEHRPCGDIDIWLFGKQKEADAALAASSNFHDPSFKIDSSHHHHTVFNWNGFSVENHYDFINVYRYESNKKYEALLKELGKDGTNSVILKDEKVYLPKPNLHTLFLLRHSMMDFVASALSLRQVLDWAFFVAKNTRKIDWKWILGVLKEYQMLEFFNILNAICVDNLGFQASIFPSVQFNPELKEKVLDDIIDPEFARDEPKAFLTRYFYKYKRWKGNAWKQSLCFKESRWDNFKNGIKAKLIKPNV